MISYKRYRTRLQIYGNISVNKQKRGVFLLVCQSLAIRLGFIVINYQCPVKRLSLC